MKIILSPSKTQDFTTAGTTPVHEPRFMLKAEKLARKIARIPKKELSAIMNLNGELLEETYRNFKNYSVNTPNPAIYTYTGLVYKYMAISDYSDDMLNYLDSHLCILSALYGVLRPFDGIKPYRLDMKMSVTKQNLYSLWKKDMLEYFENETIIDLASGEFSKMIPLPKTTIGFREFKDGKYKNLATYSKMARGMLLDLMVKAQIDSIDHLKELEFEGYHFNRQLSKDNLILFSRDD